MSSLLISTERTYYQDTYVSELQAQVVKQARDDHGRYFIPDRTIFHPQGGGQPADDGFVKSGDHSYQVIKLVVSRDDEVMRDVSSTEGPTTIKHYYNGENPLLNSVVLTIDLAKRKLLARCHSAGHLIASLVEKEYPKLEGYKGNHFPEGQSFVQFKGSPLPDKAELKSFLERILEETIKSKVPMHVNNDDSPRKVQFEGYSEYPCGGTHVRHAGELEKVTIRSVKNKKGELKVGYDVK